jgi:MFS family permease
MTASGSTPAVWLAAAALMGVGMALLYPNLIAAMSDLTAPLMRGKALGTYRYWRDTGYAIGAVLLGGVAQLADAVRPVMWLTAALVVMSGLWIAKDVRIVRPNHQKV